MATPRKPRDYALEEERRNIRARAQGFTSRAQMRRARERKAIPTAREIRANPELKYTVKDYARDYNAQRRERKREPRKPTPQLPSRGIGKNRHQLTLAELDRINAEWARDHSKQSVTRYSSHWGERRKIMYYEAFVQGFMVPNDERQFAATYAYMVEFGQMNKEVYSDDPYRHATVQYVGGAGY